MGISNVDTGSDIPKQYDLDGTEIYREDGQTIKTIDELTQEELDKMFDDYFKE